jgi:hypothetical protein
MSFSKLIKKSYRKQIKNLINLILQLNKCQMMKLEKKNKKTSLRKREKEHRAKLDKFSKLWLIFQTYNL